MANPIKILDKERINWKLRRMAWEIWEHNIDETELIFIGIEKAGRVIAENLVGLLREICPINIVVIPIVVNKRHPLNLALDIKENLNGRTVILVDDVVNSGKTMAFTLHPLLDYDIKKLMTVVLVDRKHKLYPVSSDIVGLTVATTLQEHIEVEIIDGEVNAVYLQ